MQRILQQSGRLLRTHALWRTQTAAFSSNGNGQKAVQHRNPYAEQMYDAWIQDANSVDPTWNYYFTNVQKQQKLSKNDIENSEHVRVQTELFIKAHVILQRYKSRGHELAQLDPLNLEEVYGKFSEFGKQIARSKIEEGINLDDKEWDTPFSVEHGSYLNDIACFLNEKEVWTLREVREYCQKIYTGKIGVEFVHILSGEQRVWIQEKIEKLGLKQIHKEQRLKTLDRLIKNEAFNLFLKNKFNTLKRFGIEGSDSFISGLECLVDNAVEHGIEHIVIGMPHRGRLNTLANVLGKPREEIFAEFQDIKETVLEDGVWGHAGDVKYHLGVSQDRQYADGKKINLRILPNPSHLEAVDPCVYGTTRAIQDFKLDSNGARTLGVVVHGDAALCGQGVVYESLQMADLKGFSPQGVVHVIVNNQIGFTTTPREFRSGYQSTEVAKCVECPIFHVNGDEPDLVDQVMQVALEFRQKFRKDVVVDIIGYRRYGHNELDQPMFTQPIMYRQIMSHAPVVELYSQKLIAEGLTTREAINEKMIQHNEKLEESYAISRQETFNPKDWHAKTWEHVREPEKFGVIKNTSVPVEKLREIGAKLTDIPEDFNVHPLLKRIFKARRESIDTGKKIDMATAEALAWGTLLYEGFGVRLSGQDVERGTFSHRHSILIDQKKDRTYVPFHALMSQEQIKKKWFQVRNSHLSEFGVLGFEYGYSITNPNVLCMWEAQFGDFANGAQVMIDNFIASGETKWGVQTGLVLLLPHGFDGQGAEHSSARLERFLQLADDDYTSVNINRTERLKRQVRNCNWQVVVCTTTVNYFHALRRQLRRDFRKPLIVLSSKKLLRHKGASSDLSEFENQKRFSVCYHDATADFPAEKVKRVVICSGQVYYDIVERNEQNKREDLSIIRIEQLAPFPYDFLKELLSNYKNAEFVWCQEEHKNQGAWDYVEPRIQTVLDELLHKQNFTEKKKIKYVGRKVSASTAVGSAKVHQEELNIFLAQLFDF